ncbi:MAG: DUF2000 family protein, partial [Litorimonas sp.]
AYRASADRPVVILQARPETMCSLLDRLSERPEGAAVVLFPAFARRVHGFEDYAAQIVMRHLAEEPLDGIAICGPGKWVRSLTGNLKLLR